MWMLSTVDQDRTQKSSHILFCSNVFIRAKVTTEKTVLNSNDYTLYDIMMGPDCALFRYLLNYYK